jgi:hypothetical protein
MNDENEIFVQTLGKTPEEIEKWAKETSEKFTIASNITECTPSLHKSYTANAKSLYENYEKYKNEKLEERIEALEGTLLEKVTNKDIQNRLNKIEFGFNSRINYLEYKMAILSPRRDNE